MKRSTMARRALGSLCAMLIAVAGMVAFNATPAQAHYNYSYNDICGNNYNALESAPISSGGVHLGRIVLGRDTGTGRVCVATQKYTWHGAEHYMLAYVQNLSDPGTPFHYDEGYYTEYAGEPCTHPVGCSAIHARGDLVYYEGWIGNAWASGYYDWL